MKLPPKPASKPRTRDQHRSLGTWVFGGLLLVFIVAVFWLAPDVLPEFKQRLLAILAALLAGLFGYFLTGDMGVTIESIENRFGKVGVKATGGLAVFVFVLVWWLSPLAPVAPLQADVENIKKNTGETLSLVRDLRDALRIQDAKLSSLQSRANQAVTEEPSPRAKELAAQIPDTANAYARALKAIAEQRFDDARRLLDEAQKAKEAELSDIYEARGQTERYAGRYQDAAPWFEKALALDPDDAGLLNETAVALYFASRYAEAEPLFLRALGIREKALGPDHPDVATWLNNLAALYYRQGKYEKATEAFERIITIFEKALGPDHPNLAVVMANYAAVLTKLNRTDEAAQWAAKAEAIRKSAPVRPIPSDK